MGLAEEEFRSQLDLMSRIIRKRAKRLVRRSVMYGYEDLVQECSMVLWRVITKYPAAKGVDLLKLFNRSLKNHFVSIFRQDREWLKLEDRTERQVNPLEAELGGTRRGILNRHVLPWDFFRCRLALIATKLDKEKYIRLCEIPSRINDRFLRRKEAALKEIV